jgi:hypothetical protein
MIGFDFCAVRGPWLEYGNALALRARLAGLTMVGTSFGNVKGESPPAAASAEAYRARALTSSVLHAGLSDLPSISAYGERLQINCGGRASGAVRTVEVERGLESPWQLSPKEATRLPARRRNSQTVSGQPSVPAALPPVEFDSARVFGKRIVTDQDYFPRNPPN